MFYVFYNSSLFGAPGPYFTSGLLVSVTPCHYYFNPCDRCVRTHELDQTVGDDRQKEHQIPSHARPLSLKLALVLLFPTSSSVLSKDFQALGLLPLKLLITSRSHTGSVPFHWPAEWNRF